MHLSTGQGLTPNRPGSAVDSLDEFSSPEAPAAGGQIVVAGAVSSAPALRGGGRASGQAAPSGTQYVKLSDDGSESEYDVSESDRPSPIPPPVHPVHPLADAQGQPCAAGVPPPAELIDLHGSGQNSLLDDIANALSIPPSPVQETMSLAG